MKNLKEYGFKSKNLFYTIAEIGINHNGNLKNAIKLIKSAKKSGANSVKFQTYTTEKRVSKNSPIFDILKKCELSQNDFKIIKSYADDIKIDFFSTPFDIESVDFLNSIGVNKYKVSSFDINNFDLLRKIASKKKTVIMSIGMANIKEVNKAFKFLTKSKIKIAILHCISSYPLDPYDANLNVINRLKKNYNSIIGYSDHTNSIEVPLYAASMGAQIIEKHFTINKRDKVVDKVVSIDEKQMKKLSLELNKLSKILGSDYMGLRKSEKVAEQFKRKIR